LPRPLYAHLKKIKNANTRVHSALSRVACTHRLLLTGTPVENNAQELLTLLSFLVPKLFAHAGSKGTQLAALFRGLDRCAEDERAPRVAKVQRLMRPFVLRRLKADVLLELPPKTEEVARVPMPAQQRAVYDETVKRIARENQTRLQLWAQRKQLGEPAGRLQDELAEPASTRESSGWEGGSWIASAFTELRKAAQHPLLLQRHYRDQLHKVAHALWCEGHFGDKCSEETVLEHVKSMSDLDIHLSCKSYSALRSLCLPAAAFFTSAKTAKLAEMLPSLFEQGHRALIFSQVRRSVPDSSGGSHSKSCDASCLLPLKRVVLADAARAWTPCTAPLCRQ
jgi:SWI/SNF-related matrix-associated actin-dependent regulator 1 of chromatin subfamily A